MKKLLNNLKSAPLDVLLGAFMSLIATAMPLMIIVLLMRMGA